jgi:DegV family protein with EDD domain
MKVKIVTDSHASLPTDIVKKEKISIIESKVYFGDETRKELSEIDRNDFMKSLSGMKEFPKTTIASPQEAFEILEQATKEDFDEIFYIGVSPTVSNQYNSAKVAAKKLAKDAKITLYECGLSTASQGALVYNAIKLLKKGKTIPEVITELDKMKAQTLTIGVSPSFEGLFKTGKIQKKPSLNIMSKVMNLKPLFHIVLDSPPQSIGAGMGFGGALKKVFERFDEFISSDLEYDLLFTDANNQKFYNKIESELRKRVKIHEVLKWELSPCVFNSTGVKSFQITIFPHVE